MPKYDTYYNQKNYFLPHTNKYLLLPLKHLLEEW